MFKEDLEFLRQFLCLGCSKHRLSHKHYMQSELCNLTSNPPFTIIIHITYLQLIYLAIGGEIDYFDMHVTGLSFDWRKLKVNWLPAVTENTSTPEAKSQNKICDHHKIIRMCSSISNPAILI